MMNLNGYINAVDFSGVKNLFSYVFLLRIKL